jgi:hypothetical protein
MRGFVTRPSEPILNLLRDVVRKKGLTTAQLSERLGVDRGLLKRQLAGEDPLTIDEFIALSDALELGPEQLGLRGPQPAPRLALAPPGSIAQTNTDFPDLEPPDALGNLPKQVLQLGFALGVDLFLLLDAAQLEGSNVPPATLASFKDILPIRLEARFHAHNRPRFHEDRFECVLSFDRLYTCSFPWSAFKQIQFTMPAESGAPRPAPPPAPSPAPKPSGGGHLRLVKE